MAWECLVGWATTAGSYESKCNCVPRYMYVCAYIEKKRNCERATYTRVHLCVCEHRCRMMRGVHLCRTCVVVASSSGSGSSGSSSRWSLVVVGMVVVAAAAAAAAAAVVVV